MLTRSVGIVADSGGKPTAAGRKLAKPPGRLCDAPPPYRQRCRLNANRPPSAVSPKCIP
jgi:hypothetical protein